MSGNCRWNPVYNGEVPRIIIVHLTSVADCRIGTEVSSVRSIDVNNENCHQY